MRSIAIAAVISISLLLARDLVRKPAPTFRDHAPSTLVSVKVEAAIDRRAVARRVGARLIRLVRPPAERLLVHAARQQRRLGGGTKDDAGARARGARDLAPECVELRVGHPVL